MMDVALRAAFYSFLAERSLRFPRFNWRTAAMRIPLPTGDVLIPDIEFAETLNVTRRTLGNLDRQGCPFVIIGGCKFRPLNEGLSWIASRIQRRNPRRSRPRKTEGAAGEAA